LTITIDVLKIKEGTIAFYSAVIMPLIQAGRPKLQQNKRICGFMRRKSIASELMKQCIADSLSTAHGPNILG